MRDSLLNELCVVAVIAGMLLPMAGCHTSRKATSQGFRYEKVDRLPGGNGDRRPEGSSRYADEGLRPDQQKLVSEAMTWLGVPYRYGGEDFSGADCSGLTTQVYLRALGIKLPRTSRQQQEFCCPITVDRLEAGDLVFFATGRDKQAVSHVGMYIGNGRFIHASGSKGVIISELKEGYYVRNFHSSGFVTRRSDPRRQQRLETSPMQLIPSPELQRELDRAIEEHIDSVYAPFFE